MNVMEEGDRFCRALILAGCTPWHARLLLSRSGVQIPTMSACSASMAAARVQQLLSKTKAAIEPAYQAARGQVVKTYESQMAKGAEYIVKVWQWDGRY